MFKQGAYNKIRYYKDTTNLIKGFNDILIRKTYK